MAVRRIRDRQETYQLGHLKLYRDDLIEIAKVLAELGTLEVDCGGRVMDNPGALENLDLPERLPDVSMAVWDGKTKVEVKLGESEASVRLTEPTTFTLGTLSRIEKLARQRRRLVAPVKYNTAAGPRVVLVATRAPKVRSSAVLINANRSERPTFWQRARDDWIIAVVMLVLGAVIGGVVGYWVNTIT